MEHLTEDQLDALVMGSAPQDPAVHLHLATCEACARRLVRAARFESELYDAAAVVAVGKTVTLRTRHAAAPRWQVAVPVAAALAVAAFGTWSLVSRERPGPPPRATAIGGVSQRVMRAEHEVPPEDICRCVTVASAEGPPTDPGGSQMCPPASGR